MITQSSLTTDELWKTVLDVYNGQVTYIGPRSKKPLVSEFCKHFMFTDSSYIKPISIRLNSRYARLCYFSYLLDGPEYDKALEGSLKHTIQSLSSGAIYIALIPFKNTLRFKKQLLSMADFVSVCCVYNDDVSLISAVKV